MYFVTQNIGIVRPGCNAANNIEKHILTGIVFGQPQRDFRTPSGTDVAAKPMSSTTLDIEVCYVTYQTNNIQDSAAGAR